MTAAPAGGQLRLRVTVADAWQIVPLSMPPDGTVADLKSRALAGAGVAAHRAEEFEVKVGGARVPDERQRLDAAGVGDGAALVVLPRRRRAVR